VQVLLCGAVSRPVETALIGTGVRVIGLPCGGLDIVLSVYIKGRLGDKSFQSPVTAKRDQKKTGCQGNDFLQANMPSREIWTVMHESLDLSLLTTVF
jgi:hypothetical protein